MPAPERKVDFELDLQVEQAGHQMQLRGADGIVTVRFTDFSSLWHFAKWGWHERKRAPAGIGVRLAFGPWNVWLRRPGSK